VHRLLAAGVGLHRADPVEIVVEAFPQFVEPIEPGRPGDAAGSLGDEIGEAVAGDDRRDRTAERVGDVAGKGGGTERGGADPGDGDRVEIALEADLGPADIAAIAAKLARMDADEPWTKKTLALIEKHPRVAASQLAAKLGRETLPFKVDVRKLKKLGLTQSFEVGYELSPRGRAYLAARGAKGRKKQ